ncbi:MAG: V-type ATPase subunit [Christensenellales bacterium]|jgi:V/A-type H+-transporting ATPase subunit C
MSEKNSNYSFAAARVKAIESRLITKDKLGRLMESKDFDSAMRILQELGYGQSVASKDSFEQLINNELSEADDLLIFLSPSDVFIKIMRTQKDYHNLKILIKLTMLNQDLDSIELTPGNISVEILKRAISENDYRELPQTMTDALVYIDKQFASVNDVSIVGITLDKAYAKEINTLIHDMHDPLVSAYFQAYFDLSNIIAFMRIRLSGYGKEVFEKTFFEGGNIEKNTFINAFDLSDENIYNSLFKGDFSRAFSSAFAEYQKSKNLYMLEKARDDYLLQMLRAKWHDMFGIGPLMCYYIAKQREAAAVRMVMTAKLGGINADVVSERMKELF